MSFFFYKWNGAQIKSLTDWHFKDFVYLLIHFNIECTINVTKQQS